MVLKISEACDELKLTEEQCKLLEELFPKLCTCVRKKRAPSERNKYIGKCVKERGQDTTVQDAFRECSRAFKEGKR